MSLLPTDALPSRRRRIQLIVAFYTLTLVAWVWRFPVTPDELEYVDAAFVGLAVFFTAGTLFVITDLDIITIELGWTVLTYSFYVRLLDELAEGPEAVESVLPGTIRLVGLALVFLGFVRSTTRLNSKLSERDERLAVLNRILRHNLRNSLTLIIPALDRAREQADADTEATYATALETARSLSDLGEKTREADRLLRQHDGEEPVDLNEVVETHVAYLRDTYDEVTFVVEPAPEPAYTAGSGIREAVENVIENACEHNDAADPVVTAAVETDASSVRVSVHDNGSGIPSHELDPIREGTETSLDHTSGIGLWLLHWIVERVGGELSFCYQDGQTVTLRFPRTGTGGPLGRLSGLVGERVRALGG